MSTFFIFRFRYMVFLTGMLVGCSEGKLAINDAWISEAPENVMAQAGYFVIDNDSKKSRTLTALSSEAFESIEMHRSVYDKHTDVIQMIHQSTVEIPPQQELRFEPGGYHLMLMQKKMPLKEGDKVTIKLLFSDAAEFNVNFVVRREKFSL